MSLQIRRCINCCVDVMDCSLAAAFLELRCKHIQYISMEQLERMQSKRMNFCIALG